jgi:hypothetical protein
LLHQEFVDYDLPPGLGWDAPADGAINSVKRCLSPFGFAEADKREGPAAVAARRRQMHEHWRASGKFVLPRQASAELVAAQPDAAAGTNCALHFGPGDNPAGDAAACSISGKDEESPPSAGKACYAWCEGAYSQAHSAVSLFHVQPRSS